VSNLATETFRGVELLEAGVRIHGRGSPAAGDVYSVAALSRMAAAPPGSRRRRMASTTARGSTRATVTAAREESEPG
jgi:hypothetical protein